MNKMMLLRLGLPGRSMILRGNSFAFEEGLFFIFLRADFAKVKFRKLLAVAAALAIGCCATAD
jgi:hypothetical protein